MTRTVVLVPRRRDVIAAWLHANRDVRRAVQPDPQGHTAYLRERQHTANAGAHSVAAEAVEALRKKGVPVRETARAGATPNAVVQQIPSQRAAASRAEVGRAEAAQIRDYIVASSLVRISQLEDVQNRLACVYERVWQRHAPTAGVPLNATIAVDRSELPAFLRDGSVLAGVPAP